MSVMMRCADNVEGLVAARCAVAARSIVAARTAMKR
jgi:hypothetical protein